MIVDTNRLQVIESDLFVYNPSLMALAVQKNEVKHIGHNVFDHLNELTSIHFSLHACSNQDANDARAAVELIIFNLQRNCPATIEQTELRIVNGTKFQVKTNLQIAEQIEPLNEKVNSNHLQLKSDIAELTEKLQRLEHRLEQLPPSVAEIF